MSWSISEAKARLSALLVDTRGGPQVIENRGEAVAVVLSIADYQRLQTLASTPRPTAMQRWLATIETLKASEDLEITLPARVVHDRDVPALGED